MTYKADSENNEALDRAIALCRAAFGDERPELDPDPEPGCYWGGARGTPTPAELAERVGLDPDKYNANVYEHVHEELDEVGDDFAATYPGFSLMWEAGDCFIVADVDEDEEDDLIPDLPGLTLHFGGRVTL